MKQQLCICLLALVIGQASAVIQEFSSRAVKEVAKKSYMQYDRMSDLQHKKEKRLARQQRIAERQEKRHLDSGARRAQLQTHSNRVAAQRTRADHIDQIRDIRRLKLQRRLNEQQAQEHKQAYIDHEKKTAQQLSDMHNAAREALRRRKSA